ncbi:MAG: hypothetical protein P4L95_22185 [Rouxiella aceris]|uniref:hypothetical protein n=1 Tax=Rouxiella aceris TaxID=2703884 RepID=UPI00283C2E50|nr:hypothetical protein [Rouxiella aceris]MDR3434572.1 hypothetical protein [Rouxiella aceris]
MQINGRRSLLPLLLVLGLLVVTPPDAATLSVQATATAGVYSDTVNVTLVW